MNNQDRSELLNDVLAGDHCEGLPEESNVIALIRREKAARKRRRCIATGAACALLATAATPLIRHIETPREPQSSVASTGPLTKPDRGVETRRLEIERIGDEELLELLEDQPLALVQFPDGERQLMLVVGSHSASVP